MRRQVRKLTDAMVSTEGDNMRPVTWCVFEEDVKNLAAGQPARA